MMRLTTSQLELLKGIPSSVITKGKRQIADQLVGLGLAKWDPEYDGYLEPTAAGIVRANQS
jgi:hypothetical protein